MPVWLIVFGVALYMLGLFVIAWRRDREAEADGFQQSPIVYALALAVYCTSWTYFGAVGTAASSGWDYLPIYLGPALVFLLTPGVIRRIGDIVERESITSLSDFLSARYGKSQAVAATATLAAVMGSLPYIALQLKSVGTSFQELSAGGGGSASATDETVLLTALVLALFTIFVGARRSDTTERNAGMMRVLALEAVIKLGALVAVCALSLMILSSGDAPLAPAPQVFADTSLSGRFITITILSMAAIICLPRQFHVAMIERRSAKDVGVARWVFPLYLAATSLVVIPITLAGLRSLPETASADLFVLSLPLNQGEGLLAFFVFLGGFSAATGMVVVSTVALSTMVTNDLVLPAIMKSGRFSSVAGDAGARILSVRRFVILGILMLSYGYYRAAGGGEALAQIGLLSFAAAIQFAPALIGAIYWRGGRRAGALAGLTSGIAIWAYTLFLPNLIGGEIMAAALPAWLEPHALFGISFGDALTHGVVFSLGVNALVYVLVSLRSAERLRDRVQAAVFVGDGAERITQSTSGPEPSENVTPDGLHALAARFLDAEAVSHAFDRFEEETKVKSSGDERADWRLVQRTERLLASAIGASSARVVMSSAVGGGDVALGDVLSILDHKTQAERFDRNMLQSMLENIAQGVSVVDQDQKLVAWNSAYVDLFNYPADSLSIGQPIEDLIAHNIQSGWIDGDPSQEARRRIAHMKAGRPHTYERQNPDGRWLRITGSPMPGGGYVTSFTDVTADKIREQALIDANETLETRVRDRTRDLEVMASKLDDARKLAEGATASKTRFLAAASHDLLQPLNAARLFLGSIKTADKNGSTDNADLLAKTDRAIQSADDLLKGLLDISRLDHGDAAPNPKRVQIGPMLEDLADEAAPMAAQAGLEIRVAPTQYAVAADPDFLTSILRNFISNARRYTRAGGVLLGARRRGDRIRIEVWDTGPGISDDRLERLFEEFQRFEDADNMGVRGAGLGLSVAARLAKLMDADITVKSVVGKGSVFSVDVPLSNAADGDISELGRRQNLQTAALEGLQVLCVDDEPAILDAMDALLTRWGCTAHTCRAAKDAFEIVDSTRIDALVTDYDLRDSMTGLDLIAQLNAKLPHPSNTCLLTAKANAETNAATEHLGADLLSKPASPQALQEFLIKCAARMKAHAAE